MAQKMQVATQSDSFQTQGPLLESELARGRNTPSAAGPALQPPRTVLIDFGPLTYSYSKEAGEKEWDAKFWFKEPPLLTDLIKPKLVARLFSGIAPGSIGSHEAKAGPVKITLDYRQPNDKERIGSYGMGLERDNEELRLILSPDGKQVLGFDDNGLSPTVYKWAGSTPLGITRLRSDLLDIHLTPLKVAWAPDAMERAGFSIKELQESAARARQLAADGRALAAAKKDLAKKMPWTDKYGGRAENTTLVAVNECCFVSPQEKKRDGGLYTYAADQCSVVVGIAKDRNGQVLKIGLVHSSPEGTRLMGQFVQELKAGNPAARVSFYADLGSAGEKAYGPLRKAGKVEYLHTSSDMREIRPGAMAVDFKGNVYVGERPDLNRLGEVNTSSELRANQQGHYVRTEAK